MSFNISIVDDLANIDLLLPEAAQKREPTHVHPARASLQNTP